jgi:hypothetical protein
MSKNEENSGKLSEISARLKKWCGSAILSKYTIIFKQFQEHYEERNTVTWNDISQLFPEGRAYDRPGSIEG